MVKLKQEITPKNAVSKSMQTTLGAALPEVKATKKPVATTEDQSNMISVQMEWAMMELNGTNEALIWVKGNIAPISSFQTYSSNHMIKSDTTGLWTYNGTRTLDAITAWLSTWHCQFTPCAQELGLTEECGISLTMSWTAAALVQFHDNPAVWANHGFPADASAGVAWDDFSAAVKEALIPHNAVTRLKQSVESLCINGGKCGSTIN